MASKIQLAALKNVVAPAQLSQHRYGVPASVTLVQWWFESAQGTSQLARRCNNFFGVKAIQGQDYMEFHTDEIVKTRTVVELAKFVRYPSAIESFQAHGKLLATLARYQPAMKALPDVDAFCNLLHQCGYSTTPDYGHRLILEIDYLKLRQYDITPPTEPAKAQEAA